MLKYGLSQIPTQVRLLSTSSMNAKRRDFYKDYESSARNEIHTALSFVKTKPDLKRYLEIHSTFSAKQFIQLMWKIEGLYKKQKDRESLVKRSSNGLSVGTLKFDETIHVMSALHNVGQNKLPIFEVINEYSKCVLPDLSVPYGLHKIRGFRYQFPKSVELQYSIYTTEMAQARKFCKNHEETTIAEALWTIKMLDEVTRECSLYYQGERDKKYWLRKEIEREANRPTKISRAMKSRRPISLARRTVDERDCEREREQLDWLALRDNIFTRLKWSKKPGRRQRIPRCKTNIVDLTDDEDDEDDADIEK